MEVAPKQPVCERCLPAVVIDPRRQFRDIVGRRIGFNPRDLAEVIHGVRSIRGAAAYAKEKNSTWPCFDLKKKFESPVHAFLV